jgi:hypothetical protein
MIRAPNMIVQPDLFGLTPSLPPNTTEAELQRYGRWDARTGLPLYNDYSAKLSELAFGFYQAGFRMGRQETGGT